MVSGCIGQEGASCHEIRSRTEFAMTSDGPSSLLYGCVPVWRSATVRHPGRRDVAM